MAELQLLDTTRKLVLDVETAFVDVQLAKLNLALARENLDALNGVVSVNVERVRTGDLAQVELARSRLAALQFENDVEQQSAKLAIARSRLAVIGSVGVRAIPSMSPAISAATWRRSIAPRCRRARSTGARICGPREATRRVRSPISGCNSRTARSTTRSAASTTGRKAAACIGNNYGVFFSVPLPVFNRNQGEVARAPAQQQQLETKTTRARGRHRRPSSIDAFTEYTSARRIVERIETDMLAQARDVRTTMEYSYRRGEASLVEFLDAVRAFNDTHAATTRARADYARSLYALDAISGQVTP